MKSPNESSTAPSVLHQNKARLAFYGTDGARRIEQERQMILGGVFRQTNQNAAAAGFHQFGPQRPGDGVVRGREYFPTGWRTGRIHRQVAVPGSRRLFRAGDRKFQGPERVAGSRRSRRAA